MDLPGPGADRQVVARAGRVDPEHRGRRRRHRAAAVAGGINDRPIRFMSARLLFRWGRLGPAATGMRQAPVPARRRVVTIVVRIPRLDLPRPRLLDLYIMRQFLRVFGLASIALLGIFYIATLTEFATYLFRGTATTRMVFQHFYFETPRYVTFLIPLSALISTLVVFGLLTKNSELIVMRACGVSLYRSAVPIVLLAIGLSARCTGCRNGWCRTPTAAPKSSDT